MSRTRIALPPPPSGREYNADFNEATSRNSLSGAFGHRPTSECKTANSYIRTRIAHAKLINGRYGVLAPRSCGNCKDRGTACMVYHPNLDGDGRALGTYCGKCRDRSVKCDIGPRPFAKILESTSGVGDTPDADSGAEADSIAVQARLDHDDTMP